MVVGGGGGGGRWQPGGAELPVVGDGAVPGGVDAGHGGAHAVIFSNPNEKATEDYISGRFG